MYEFLDLQGERVTVRSVRTLGVLLGEGQITAETRFRRAGEADFGMAAIRSYGRSRRSLASC